MKNICSADHVAVATVGRKTNRRRWDGFCAENPTASKLFNTFAIVIQAVTVQYEVSVLESPPKPSTQPDALSDDIVLCTFKDNLEKEKARNIKTNKK